MRVAFGLLIGALLAGCQTAPPPAPPSGTCAPQASDYPIESIRALEQGLTRIAFTPGPDGRALDPQVVQSSGHDRLDAAALRRLAACTLRFPGPPPAGRLTIDFTWTLSP